MSKRCDLLQNINGHNRLNCCTTYLLECEAVRYDPGSSNGTMTSKIKRLIEKPSGS